MGALLCAVSHEHVRALWHTDSEQNIDQEQLWELARWDDSSARDRVDLVQHRLARHLVSKLLVKEPGKRLTMTEVLSHPFLAATDDVVVSHRLAGEVARWDAFLGYRVSTEREALEQLHGELTKRGYRVFWGKFAPCEVAGSAV